MHKFSVSTGLPIAVINKLIFIQLNFSFNLLSVVEKNRYNTGRNIKTPAQATAAAAQCAKAAKNSLKISGMKILENRSEKLQIKKLNSRLRKPAV